MATETSKCEHPSCRCIVRDEKEFDGYCSSYCQDAKDLTELSCGCGHPGCEIS